MINIDTRIIEELTAEECFIMLHLAKRCKKTKSSYPCKGTLRKDTGLGQDRLDKAIKGLKEKGFIETKQRVVNNKFSSNIYKITTKYIGIYFNCSDEEIEEDEEIEDETDETRVADFGSTETSSTETPPTKSLKRLEVINKKDIKNIQKDLLKKVKASPKTKPDKFDSGEYARTIFTNPEIVEKYLDYLEIRKAKGLKTLAPTVNKHKKEIDSAENMDEVFELLDQATEKNWSGLKLEWIRKTPNPTFSKPQFQSQASRVYGKPPMTLNATECRNEREFESKKASAEYEHTVTVIRLEEARDLWREGEDRANRELNDQNNQARNNLQNQKTLEEKVSDTAKIKAGLVAQFNANRNL